MSATCMVSQSCGIQDWLLSPGALWGLFALWQFISLVQIPGLRGSSLSAFSSPLYSHYQFVNMLDFDS